MKILDGCQLAITSMSLGWAKAGHKIEDKLQLAADYGYKGIELFHDDIDDLAARKHQTDIEKGKFGPSDPGCRSTHRAQLKAAEAIRDQCELIGIKIICLQPFMGYEGLLDRDGRAAKMGKLRRWFELAHVLETDTIQIPSSFEPADKVTENMEIHVQDLRRIADMGYEETPRLNFVFEALCWGTRCDTWEKSWEVVKKVDRANFGLCLDSFNIAGRIYADPTSPDGKTCENALEVVQDSMRRLVQEVDIKKVFYVQIVDAALLTKPLVEGHELYNESQPARMSWSRSCRLFYGEQNRGGYLPIRMIAQALFVELGFRGWVSLELFNARMSDEGPEVPEELAQRGALSWEKLQRDVPMFLEDDHGPLPTLTEVPTAEFESTRAALLDERKESARKSQQDLLAMLDPILPRKSSMLPLKSSKDQAKEKPEAPESSKGKGKVKLEEPSASKGKGKVKLEEPSASKDKGRVKLEEPSASKDKGKEAQKEAESRSPPPAPKNSEKRDSSMEIAPAPKESEKPDPSIAPFADELQRFGIKKPARKPLYTPPSGSPHPGSLKAPSDVITPLPFQRMEEEPPQPPPQPPHEPHGLRKLMSTA